VWYTTCVGLFGNRQAVATIPPERVTALEAEVRSLKRELVEIEDKVLHWMRRSDKRARTAAAEAESDGAPENPALRRLMERRARRGLHSSLPNGG